MPNIYLYKLFTYANECPHLGLSHDVLSLLTWTYSYTQQVITLYNMSTLNQFRYKSSSSHIHRCNHSLSILKNVKKIRYKL